LRFGRMVTVRFTLVEVALIVFLIATVTWAVSRHGNPPELAWLVERYGRARHSQSYEEFILRDFFHDQRGGTFVDVGAAHHEYFSNTYYLELNLGWSGVAVEPNRQFEAGWRQFRPRTVFAPFFAADRSDSRATLFVVESNPLVSSASRDFTASWGSITDKREVPTITLTDLLDRLKVPHVDFMSMDIELAEPKALAGFDIDRFRPALVCIEAHPPIRQVILDYFAAHRYAVVGRYLPVDEMNLYFAPLGTAPGPIPVKDRIGRE
jgi:FkbM family methyltransferase